MCGTEGGPCRADWHRVPGPPQGAHRRLLACHRTLTPPSGKSCHCPCFTKNFLGSGGLGRAKRTPSGTGCSLPSGN